MFNVGDTLLKLATESGFAGFFANGGWQNLVMIVIACVLLYLGIVKGFEPLLLVGIAFGCLLANVSYFPGLDAVNPELNATNAMYHPELWSAFLDSTSPYYHSYGHVLSNAGLLDIFYIGVKAGLYPSLIFMGVGAMTDFGPLIADPKSLLLGAAAQLGVFVAFFGAICLGFTGPAGRFHRHYRRCRRPDGHLPDEQACSGSARRDRHCRVFLHGADPDDPAPDHEAHDL